MSELRRSRVYPSGSGGQRNIIVELEGNLKKGLFPEVLVVLGDGKTGPGEGAVTGSQREICSWRGDWWKDITANRSLQRGSRWKCLDLALLLNPHLPPVSATGRTLLLTSGQGSP